MKFEINQNVYFIISRGGQIEIIKMTIDVIERGEKDHNAIYYSGDTTCGDCDREYMHEDRLFPSYEDAIKEIERQIQNLRG